MKTSRHTTTLPLLLVISSVLSACGGGGSSGTTQAQPIIPPVTYTIAGTVNGLASGATVTLLNNGADSQTITSDGALKFDVPVAAKAAYAVTVGTQPTGQICTVSNASGSALSANISNVSVTCSATTYTISGTVTGLNSGTKVTLNNNAANPTTVTANGAFSFSTPVAYGADYAVTIGFQPLAQTCNVTSGTGSTVAADVGNVMITCGTPTETVLYSFGSRPDAEQPTAGLLLGSDGNFYSTSNYGGTNLKGAIFKITPAGVETVLYSFAGGTDGAYPNAALISGSDGNFYGTTSAGGDSLNNYGSLFKVTPDGVETVLYAFAGGADGAYPNAALLLGSDGNFYGTTTGGGAHNHGTVFQMTPAGVETVLYSFAAATDGGSPNAPLVAGNDGNYYGTTTAAGTGGNGTVFKITPAGVETIIYSFAGATDGRNPYGALVLGSDGNFYGTTANGGVNNYGTVFQITPAGIETVMYSFAGVEDGASPRTALIAGADGNFYGTTQSGGLSGNGTIFKVTPAGVESLLYSFAGGTDGAYCNIPLTLGSDGYFYGLTHSGGSANQGTVFRY